MPKLKLYGLKCKNEKCKKFFPYKEFLVPSGKGDLQFNWRVVIPPRVKCPICHESSDYFSNDLMPVNPAQ